MSDPVWEQLYREADEVAMKEPALASLLKQVILSRESLEDALSVRLSRKLAYHATPEGYLKDVFHEAFLHEPGLGERVRHDIMAVRTRDPACRNYITPMLYFKGFQALTCYRVSHHLWNQGREDLAMYLQSLTSEVLAVDIHPAAKIGCGIMLDHATSFVAGETTVIENNVSILHEVTLGGTGKEQGDRHPKVRHGVLIGAGAKLLGNIEIGIGAKVGAGSVVLEDVPPHVTVAGVPAKIVAEGKGEDPAFGMDHHLNC
ncbi:serine O-acetyltransferase [Rubellicoccus peritrichatus]|uniref:Serine acetyltransferase n=1 Tax=Rubellicoccus peritrichatus TaxID=3080537 RepID=A0AAQ3QWJ7_9BACT|nr:serine O-acetyltransferase [Puniceicoccus sp. CR14]WOO41957.1 serine O-acetyltransferase [Puniceicoccus sp. CR14]